MRNRDYRTTKYILTLASTIIDRLLFYIGLALIVLLYYLAFDISKSLKYNMMSGITMIESPREELKPLFDFVMEFLNSMTDIAMVGVISAFLTIITVFAIIHFLYMLPMIIVSHVTLTSAKKSGSTMSYDVMGNDRYKCDAILKLVMHTLALFAIIIIAFISSAYVVLILTIPFMAVIVLSIVTLSIQSTKLKMESVEVDPVYTESESEYTDFES